jgi:AraC family transcriptional regulator
MLRLGFGSFNGQQERVDIDALSFSLVRDDPNLLIRRHTHEAGHFQIILDGEYITEASDVDPLCGSMTTLWVPAGTTHRDRFRTRGGSFLTVSFTDEFLTAIEPCEMPRVAQRVTSCGALAHALHREMLRLDSVSDLALEGIALQMLARTSRTMRLPAYVSAHIARQAYAIVQERFDEKLSLQGIAAELYVTPRVVSIAVRQSYGCSLSEMLRDRRVRHAIGKMTDEGLGLAEIAALSGFADQAQLTKAFRRVIGATPAAFRRK